MRSADFDHLEVFFADAAFRANEVVRHVFPTRSGGNALVLASFGFVVDPAANDALPFFHAMLFFTIRSRHS